MALGVDGMRAGKVVRKAIFLTLGTAIFIFCLTLVYESMRAVMDVGGACASGGAYEIRQAVPEGRRLDDAGRRSSACSSPGSSRFLGVFSEGGPRPYVFAWSALFLALGWNFLDYGFNPPGGTAPSSVWLICGFVFVAMGGAPAAPPALAEDRALDAVGARLPAGRRPPPPLQAAPDPQAPPWSRARRPSRRRVRTSSTPYAPATAPALVAEPAARAIPSPHPRRRRPSPTPTAAPEGRRGRAARDAGRPARARHARRRRVRARQARGARRGGSVMTTQVAHRAAASSRWSRSRSASGSASLVWNAVS